jgi:hypothetical protein
MQKKKTAAEAAVFSFASLCYCSVQVDVVSDGTSLVRPEPTTYPPPPRHVSVLVEVGLLMFVGVLVVEGDGPFFAAATEPPCLAEPIGAVASAQAASTSTAPPRNRARLIVMCPSLLVWSAFVDIRTSVKVG